MDTPVLMLASKMSFSSFAMIAAKDYFFEQGKRQSIATLFMNLIPISRKATRKTLAKNLELCREFISTSQKKLIIYPEGTRSITGELQSFKRGPAMIATELNLPIVPVFIQGTHQALSKRTRFPRRNKIKVVIGDPIYPDKYQPAEQSVFDIYRLLTTHLETQIKQLKERFE